VSANSLRGLLALALCAATLRPAQALDTWEVYPIGLSAAEAYLVRYGQGADSDDQRGLLAITGAAVGVTARAHAYVFTGLISNDRHEGGLDTLTLGYFQTLIDQTAFDLDAWAELGAQGEGLGEARRGVGIEVNYEGPRGGLYWRGTQHWERDAGDGVEPAVTGQRRRFSYGLHLRVGPAGRLLAEWRQERLDGYQSLPDGNRTESWAVGFNRTLSKTTELVVEARAVEPPADTELERSWDLTAGWVVVW
jgi:hypothetical protein